MNSNQFARTHIPIVWNNLSSRWFVVNKPPGVRVTNGQSGTESSHSISVETALAGFSDKPLYFPIELDRHAQGLLPVATDRHMSNVIESMVRRGVLELKYRVLADASSMRETQSTFPNDFRLFGSSKFHFGGKLVAPDGKNLNDHGVIQSFLYGSYPRLRAPFGNSPTEYITDAARNISLSQCKRFCVGASIPRALEKYFEKSISSSLNVDSERLTFIHKRKVSSTHFKLISVSTGHSAIETAWRTAAYEVKLYHPGKNQIRIHFSECGCPLIGDTTYHAKYNSETMSRIFSVTGDFKNKPLVETSPQTSLGIQLFQLEGFDPLKSGRSKLRINLDSPSEWLPYHKPDSIPFTDSDGEAYETTSLKPLNHVIKV